MNKKRDQHAQLPTGEGRPPTFPSMTLEERTANIGGLYAHHVRQIEADYPPLDTRKLYEFIELCKVEWRDNPPGVSITWMRPYGGYVIEVIFDGIKLPIQFNADELSDGYDMIERIQTGLRRIR